MMSSYTLRGWVTIGLFGALWGAVELTLGSVLHTVYPPLASTPLTGLVLSGIGVAIALTGRHFVPKRGSILLIGTVTALLKLLSVSGVKIGPVVAILVESLLMEAILWIAQTPRPWAFIVGGALAMGWNLPHMFIMPQLLLGKNATEAFDKIVQQGDQLLRLLGLNLSAASLVLIALLLAYLLAGAISGWGAWQLGDAVVRRLGTRGSTTNGGEH
jgi:ABC-type thiamin/hydroxymethylpyrimidine transport system permease subunit